MKLEFNTLTKDEINIFQNFIKEKLKNPYAVLDKSKLDRLIDCTGNAVTNDEVVFIKPIFKDAMTCNFRHRRRGVVVVDFELIHGIIVKDSYGALKQQHTFTILKPCNQKILIKGRNLYKNGTFRFLWKDEAKRLDALNDKYQRGALARAQRAKRLMNSNFNYINNDDDGLEYNLSS